MEIKWLEDFAALAETASFSRAAELRNVTQPAFSRRIKQLETWLGVTLISRATLPTELTPAGLSFLPVAQETIRTFQAARETLRPLAEEDMIRFAALHTLTVTFFPEWVQKLSRLGELRTSFTPDRGGIEANLAALVENEADFFLTYGQDMVPLHLDLTRFSSIIVGSDKLIPVAAPELRLSETKIKGEGCLDHAIASRVTLPYLSYGVSSFFGVALSRLFATRPPFQRRTMHENTISAGLMQLALTGAGLVWLPESLVAPELASGRLLRATEDPDWTLDLEIRLYRHLEAASPKVDALWQAASALSRP